MTRTKRLVSKVFPLKTATMRASQKNQLSCCYYHLIENPDQGWHYPSYWNLLFLQFFLSAYYQQKKMQRMIRNVEMGQAINHIISCLVLPFLVCCERRIGCSVGFWNAVLWDQKHSFANPCFYGCNKRRGTELCKQTIATTTFKDTFILLCEVRTVSVWPDWFLDTVQYSTVQYVPYCTTLVGCDEIFVFSSHLCPKVPKSLNYKRRHARTH